MEREDRSGMFVGRRTTRGKVRKGHNVRPLLGFQLNQRTQPLGRSWSVGARLRALPGALPSSIPLLLSQTRQLADLQTQDTAGAAAGLTVRSPGTPFRASHAFPCLRPAHCPSFPQPVLQRLRRDTHIPICMFCCGCCFKATCGLCCRT